MRWITRERVKVDRVACPWLVEKFVDPNAEFIFVPADKVMAEAKRLDAIPYDVPNVELGHHGKECSFEAILKKYKLTGNAALVLLGKIVNGADTDNTLYRQPEGAGLEAILKKYKLTGNAALVLLGKIANGADTDNPLSRQPEGAGLEAILKKYKLTGNAALVLHC